MNNIQPSARSIPIAFASTQANLGTRPWTYRTTLCWFIRSSTYIWYIYICTVLCIYVHVDIYIYNIHSRCTYVLNVQSTWESAWSIRTLFNKRVCFGGLEPQGVSNDLEENLIPASQGEKQFPVTFEDRSLGWMLNTLWGSLRGQWPSTLLMCGVSRIFLRVFKRAVLGYYTSIIGVGSTPEDVRYSAPSRAVTGLAGEKVAQMAKSGRYCCNSFYGSVMFCLKMGYTWPFEYRSGGVLKWGQLKITYINQPFYSMK